MTDSTQTQELCPKCKNPLGPIQVTRTGRKLQRCTMASPYDPHTKPTGCDFVKWLPVEPQTLDEKCPKCGSPVVLAVTRFGKKMKKCSTGGWDKLTRTATGCDFIEWINGTTEPLEEECPECSAKLVLYTTANGKKMKKCSTSGWDREKRQATGCTYIEWLKSGQYPTQANENQPPPAEEPPPPSEA